MDWVKDGSIKSVSGESIFELKKGHKHSVVNIVGKSGNFSADEKSAFLELVLGDDKSDLANGVRLTCHAANPDPKVKAEVWKDLTDKDGTRSLYEKRSLMAGFYSLDHIDSCSMYFDKFFECLEQVHNDHTYKYLSTFFYMMLPRMRIEDRHIVMLINVKSQVPDTSSMFMNILQDGIELLLRSKNIRERAMSKM